MYNQSILYGVIGVLLGGIIAILAASYAVNSNNANMMNMMGMNGSQMMNADHMSMDGMANTLKGKTGDDFDAIFISQMITHHQGAIDMATQAKQNAKHDEIKQLAGDIITAQEKEINQMRVWQQEWGYAAVNSPDDSSVTSHMMRH